MNIKIREIISDDYAEVVFLWNDVLEIRNVNDADFRVTMEEMNKAGNYKTFVALIDNDVVGFVTIVQSLSVGVPIGYLHIQALAVKESCKIEG